MLTVDQTRFAQLNLKVQFFGFTNEVCIFAVPPATCPVVSADHYNLAAHVTSEMER